MQILEDNIPYDYGDLVNRIAALREKVALLLEKNQTASPANNTELLKENLMLKKQLELKEIALQERHPETDNNQHLIEEITRLKQQIAANQQNENVINNNEEIAQYKLEIASLKEQLQTLNSGESNELRLIEEIQELKLQLQEKTSSNASDDIITLDEEIVQENALLKKQILDREKTISELNFKLEMFRLAKTLRGGANINEKNDELKKMISEYIKEIDKSITTLNFE